MNQERLSACERVQFESARFYPKRDWQGHWHVLDRARPNYFVIHAVSKEVALKVAAAANSLDEIGQLLLPHKKWPPLPRLKVVRKRKAS